MAENSSMADDRRPVVLIMTLQVSAQEALPILWGLEEEGVPGEVQEVSGGGAVILAKRAADMSPLNVGIGMNGAEGMVALHHRDLPGEQPLFTLVMKDVQTMQFRILGANAARLVKGEPLVFRAEPLSDGEVNHSEDFLHNDPDELVDLIVRAVLELLAKE
jgi:Dehydratase medium subunit